MHPLHIFFSPASQMGAELGVRAISHLEEVSDAGIQAMARAGTVAVLLPTTAYILRLPPPPARRMLDSGMAVALGSDFNPNAHCMAMVSTNFKLQCLIILVKLNTSIPCYCGMYVRTTHENSL